MSLLSYFGIFVRKKLLYQLSLACLFSPSKACLSVLTCACKSELAWLLQTGGAVKC